VTAVGGTSLTKASNARGWTETAWSGAGSGCSAYEAKQAWQTDSGCARRTVADVSAVADPNTGIAVYDTYGSSGWLVFGGTSLSAPIVAATYALIGSDAGAAGPSYFYGHLGNVFDVTGGSNGSCGGSYLCTAIAGYDGPTGLGSPNLGGTTAPVVNPPVATTGSASGVTQSSATLGGTVNAGGGLTTYHFEYGTTTGYGSVTTDQSAGSGTSAIPVSAAISGLAPGTPYHFRIVATNSAGTSTGADSVFTTSSSAPVPHTTVASSVTNLSGIHGSGTVSALSSLNGVFYVVRGATTDWYGQMTGVSNAATSLSFTFAAVTNSSCTQTLRAYNYATGAYATLDTRTLGTSEQTVTASPAGALADYVSGTSGTGTVRLRATCTSASSHKHQGDLMSVTWTS
jgi:hypothetical protein